MSSLTQRTNFNYSNKGNIVNLKQNIKRRKINKSNSYIFNYHPKKESFIKNNPKLFSLLDINDKITNSKGTSLPNQYKRLTDEELNKKFTVTYKIGWNYCKKLMNKIKEKEFKYLKKDPIIEEKKNNEDNSLNNKILFSEREQLNRPYLNINIQNSNNEKGKYYKKKKIPIRNLSERQLKVLKENKSLSQFNNFKNSNLSTKQKNYDIKIRTDIYLPKNYSNYELLVKNPELINQNKNENSLLKKNYSLREIKQKSTESDIFFLKSSTNKNINSPKKISKYPNFQNSDIFNLKNDMNSILKSGETYLFKPEKKSFNSNIESNSKWEPKPSIPTLYNHQSTKYNILNPSTKSISKTKEKIIEDCESKRSKNITSPNDFNPFHKQKVFSEYFDITRIYAPNVNHEYKKSYNESNDVFKKKSDICGTYYDIHNMYKDLCDKPFIKSNENYN